MLSSNQFMIIVPFVVVKSFQRRRIAMIILIMCRAVGYCGTPQQCLMTN